MKRLLMVAYHFPPLSGSSGIQRTLRFVQHLPRFGWEAAVLTTNAMAYERVSSDLMTEIPAETVVHRSFALDTARHLSIGGRHLASMARPDRWQTWRWGAALGWRKLLRQFKPHVLWSTYPIATAHLIGADLHRASGLPWIADFRDPMAQEGYPTDPATWKVFQSIEEQTLTLARFAVFTTPGAARRYAQRYPFAQPRIRVIENGYDEESFSPAPTATPMAEGGPFVLLHSGIVYPGERDPTALLSALGRLRAAGQTGPDRLRLRFRAAVHEDLLRSLCNEHRVADQVEIVPPLPYREALAEMQGVDALLVLQAANCNDQVPAKLYEYLRAQRPILALTDPAGDTAALLRRWGVDLVARLDDPSAIANLLVRVCTASKEQILPLPTPTSVRGASRLARARELAELLDLAAASKRVT